MYDVITIGSTTRDVFLKTPEFKVVGSGEFKADAGRAYRTGKAGCFMLGTKLEVSEFAIASGGGGTNAAVCFARQGFRTACVGAVGKDAPGREIIDELEKEGVKPIFQTHERHDTAYSTILVSEGGERTILEHRGANDYLSGEKIDWEEFESGSDGENSDTPERWLYVDSLGGNTELLRLLLEKAKETGRKVAFNPGKRLIKLGKDLWPFLGDIDIFIANEDESAFITGIEYSREREPEIFQKMDELVKGIVVMSKGPRGVEVSDGKNHYTAGIPDSPVVDRTGAGDSFGSGFVSGYIQSGGDIEFSVRLGTANATSVVKHFGAKKGLLKKGEWGDYPKVEVNKTKI